MKGVIKNLKKNEYRQDFQKLVNKQRFSNIRLNLSVGNSITILSFSQIVLDRIRRLLFYTVFLTLRQFDSLFVQTLLTIDFESIRVKLFNSSMRDALCIGSKTTSSDSLLYEVCEVVLGQISSGTALLRLQGLMKNFIACICSFSSILQDYKTI